MNHSNEFTDPPSSYTNASTDVSSIRTGTPILIQSGTSINLKRQVLLFQPGQCGGTVLMPQVEFQVTVFDTR